MELDEWEARYRGGAAAGQPSSLLTTSALAMPAGRALDLACGAGRNALWLAEHGWNVAAVDGSPAAIALLLKAGANRNLRVDARVVDLERDEFDIEPAGYSLIACCYYLQRNLFERIQRGLAPGGVAVVITLMSKSTYSTRPGELRGYFADWEILHDREGPDGSGHVVAEIVARKPSAISLPS